MKCYNQIGEIYGNERLENSLNQVENRRKEFDDRFEKLSGAQKLRLAIQENKYFPAFNKQALNLIELKDILILTDNEREVLYKNILRRTNVLTIDRWNKIIKMIESIDLIKADKKLL